MIRLESGVIITRLSAVQFSVSIPVEPVVKPRLTRRSSFAGSKKAKRYNAYRDKVRELWPPDIDLPPCGSHVIFLMPMPESWDDDRKKEMNGQPYNRKKYNDVDNLLKGFFDAISKEDSFVWDISASKFYAYEGRVIVRFGPMITSYTSLQQVYGRSLPLLPPRP